MEKKGAIAVFVPDLDSTPGWTALQQTDKDLILEHTSKARQFYGMGIVAEIGQCMHLIAIEDHLESIPGKPMSMRKYLETVYRKSAKSAYTKMSMFREWSKNWGSLLHYMEQNPQLVEQAMRGMGGTQMATYVGISRELKPPKVLNPTTIEGFFTSEVRPAISEIKRAARKGIKQKVDREHAQLMAFRAVHYYSKKAGLTSSADTRKFLAPIFGWTLEALAVHGTMRIGRISVPEGAYAQVGRPRKSKKAA